MLEIFIGGVVVTGLVLAAIYHFRYRNHPWDIYYPKLAWLRAGMYFCAVTDSNGCPGVSDTLVVTLLASPVPPIILRSVDTLKTVNAATWQW